MKRVGLPWVVVLASCHFAELEHVNSVYVDQISGYSVERNWRYSRAGSQWLQFGDAAEPGVVNPGVIEFVFAAEDSPVARYYDLMQSLPHRPHTVDADLAALRQEIGRPASTDSVLTGRDYARALARKLIDPINDALRHSGASAGVRWGVPVDLDAYIPLVEYERDGIRTMLTTLSRYETVSLLVMQSSATQQVLVWDVGDLPGALEASPRLDQATVAAHIVALHQAPP